METIKRFTDLSQAKKLAEILQLETADMHYSRDFGGSWFVDLEAYSSIKLPKYAVNNVEEHLLPCWSLAALLDNIPHVKMESIERNGKLQWICYSFFNTVLHGKKVLDWYDSDLCDNLIDACYDIILKLHNSKNS